jgi:arylsulfatase A-like enzyme
VLDTPDRLGLTEDALVIFSSDNGPARATGDTALNLMYDTGAGFGIAAAKGITGGRKGYKAALRSQLAEWRDSLPAAPTGAVFSTARSSTHGDAQGAE